MKKGISLPINMIVIVLIAVLVLLVIGAYFSGTFSTQVGSISLEQGFNKLCAQLMFHCEDYEDLVDKLKLVGGEYKVSSTDDTPYSLSQLCDFKGLPDAKSCANACGCKIP